MKFLRKNIIREKIKGIRSRKIPWTRLIIDVTTATFIAVSLIVLNYEAKKSKLEREIHKNAITISENDLLIAQYENSIHKEHIMQLCSEIDSLNNREVELELKIVYKYDFIKNDSIILLDKLPFIMDTDNSTINYYWYENKGVLYYNMHINPLRLNSGFRKSTEFNFNKRPM